MSNTYVYVVDRDFGFAPNPFHAICTLATCKPTIRRVAQVNDWVIGMGGRRLRATGKCIFAMKISEKISFNQYWTDPRFFDKKPVRNGSKKMLIGDNIYRRQGQTWIQLDSHHSNADGTTNFLNLEKDTSADFVLISNDYYYFGASAEAVPLDILQNLGYKNGRSHRVFHDHKSNDLIEWLRRNFQSNRVLADPFDFSTAGDRYSGIGSKIIVNS